MIRDLKIDEKVVVDVVGICIICKIEFCEKWNKEEFSFMFVGVFSECCVELVVE